MEGFIYIISIILAFLIGVDITERRFADQCKNKIVGSLEMDTSDPDGPYIFAEFNKPVETIFSNKYIVLKVNARYNSHN